MRCPERSVSHDAVGRWYEAYDGMDRGGLDRFGERWWWQDTGQPPRHERLPCARWSDEQHIVTPGRGDFESPPGGQLPANVGQVVVTVVDIGFERHWGCTVGHRVSVEHGGGVGE